MLQSTTRSLRRRLQLLVNGGIHPGERFAYLKKVTQPTLVVNGNHDVIVYTVNSLYLAQNMPNAKLILYADANHGSWYENNEDFVFLDKPFSGCERRDCLDCHECRCGLIDRRAGPST